MRDKLPWRIDLKNPKYPIKVWNWKNKERIERKKERETDEKARKCRG